MINIILSLIVFIRFMFADESISYDYRFYIAFFNELNILSIFDLFKRIEESFPYISWGEPRTSEFEFGFALISYTLGKFFYPKLLYSVIAASSIYIKLDVLRKFKVHFLLLFLFYVFDICIFESNQLRAGLALAFFMMLFYYNYQKNYNFLKFILIVLASTIHLSILVLIGLLFLSNFIISFNKKSSVKLLFYIFLLFFFIVNNLGFISSIFGAFPHVQDKIYEYQFIENNFDTYNSTSGWNHASALSLLFTLFFFLSRKFVQKKESIYGIIFSACNFILIFFSNELIIISGRLWLLCFPILLLCFSIGLEYSRPHYKNALFFLEYTIFAFLLFLLLTIIYRYPSSNFFSLIFTPIDFIPPELY